MCSIPLDELLQDFQMPDVSTCCKLSPDGQYLMVTGTYKPVLKCYDLSELTVKYERGMDAEVLRIEIMSEDYSKASRNDCRDWKKCFQKHTKAHN